MILRSAILPLAAAAIGALIFLVPAGPSKANPSPFATLLGSWGGSGEIRLDKGRKERIKCNAYYTGGGSDLGLAIRCQSDNYKIEIRSKLSYSGGRLSGNWEGAPSMLREPPLEPPLPTRSRLRSRVVSRPICSSTTPRPPSP